MAWPEYVLDTTYPCTADSSQQPALVYAPPSPNAPCPLLVALHTWSFDYSQDQAVYARWCRQNDWCMIHPDFRGRNDKPEAMGSELAVQDIVDAVAYMCDTYDIDRNRVYLCGVSGGGHAAMLLAGRHPELWAGVSAWCGISDIAAWWQQNVKSGAGYDGMIESACGGRPEAGTDAAAECDKRSPVSFLHNAAGVNLDINAGVHDGRRGSVPFKQSLYGFNAVVGDDHAIPSETIETFYDTQTAPEHDGTHVSRTLYGEHVPLFVKTAATTRVVVFEGGHEIVHLAALNWLNVQRRGAPATWLVSDPVPLDSAPDESNSGL